MYLALMLFGVVSISSYATLKNQGIKPGFLSASLDFGNSFEEMPQNQIRRLEITNISVPEKYIHTIKFQGESTQQINQILTTEFPPQNFLTAQIPDTLSTSEENNVPIGTIDIAALPWEFVYQEIEQKYAMKQAEIEKLELKTEKIEIVKSNGEIYLNLSLTNAPSVQSEVLTPS